MLEILAEFLFGPLIDLTKLGPGEAGRSELILFLLQLYTSIIGTFVVAAVVYLIVTRNQNRSIKHSKNIERLGLVDSFEERIMELFRRKNVVKADENFIQPREFRSSLDNNPWMASSLDKIEVIELDSGRYWGIDNNRYVASDAFQEILVWVRSLERSYRLKLIEGRDLFHMWRFLLPLGCSQRYSYFIRYFGGDSRELESLLRMTMATLFYCINSKRVAPIKHFIENADPLLKKDILRSLDSNEKWLDLLLKYKEGIFVEAKRPSLKVRRQMLVTLRSICSEQ